MSYTVNTILFSLSSNNVFRNLFFFPGSVFFILLERVKSDPLLRVVFVMSEEHYNIYRSFLDPHVSERFIIETFVHDKRKTFLRKLLVFFYAHFIFTNTTRMLSTMGMRPDEPPGGGSRTLLPVKITIARTLGRIPFMRTHVVPFLYKRLFWFQKFSDIIRKYQPDTVFLPHLFGAIDQQFLASANDAGLRTVGMISNWDHFDKYYIPLQATHLLAQSDQIKRFALNYQSYEESQISVVGYPQFDFIADASHANSRKELMDALGFPETAKLLLYISGSAYCPDEPDIIEAILAWADEGKFSDDVRIVIRPYQAGRAADRAFDMQKYNSFEGHPRVRFYRKEFWGDLEASMHFFNIMRHADAVIGIYTTALLEGAVLDRPLITIGFDGHASRPFNRSIRRFALREHFDDVLNSGGVRTAQNFDDLYDILSQYLTNPSCDADGRMRLREKTVLPCDGKSSERIVEALLK